MQSVGVTAADVQASRQLLISGKVMIRSSEAMQDEVGAFYWTVPAPDIVNSGRDEQDSISV